MAEVIGALGGAALKSRQVKCDMCKADIANEQKPPENPCEYHTRVLSAWAMRHQTYTNAELHEAIKIHDAEMQRMYEYNKERFGNTTKMTAYFTGAVLVATGIGQILTLKDWMSVKDWLNEPISRAGVFYIVGGVFVGGLVNLWWWFKERTAR